uniref:Fau protein n=1 Tax=Papilio polytes TaxID=76194 RepID=I4DM62_PAPPL|nr:fau protein [Papilio polytes]
MVYESDFYTTRRPYRPSSYSVTPLTSAYYLSPLVSYYNTPYVTYIPKLSQAELIYRPQARALTRLATYPEPPHHVVRVRVRPSVILRELDRIAYRRRPALAVSAVDDFYRSESTKLFEDETRRIRADTAALLHRARSVVPRAKSLAPLDTIYSYSYGEPIPYRFSNDAYVAKLLLPLRSVADTIHNISFYNEPAKKFTGRGHLACVHYSGNRAFSNRRPLYKELSVRDDVNLLSFYAKNRLAAAGLEGEKATAGGAQQQPTAAQCA